jgi:peptide deformylase
MAIREILLLGDERLYQLSPPVKKTEIDEAAAILADLGETMAAFRDKFGFGRAIAAPQIGALKRIVYLNTGDRVIGFINPELEFASDEQFELWDDCMSFPGLEVRLRRYNKVRIRYRDIHWNPGEIFFEGDPAELIQHEYDHLDGILAVQRALNPRSFRMNRERAMCY